MKLAALLSRHGAMTSKGGQDTVPALINPHEAMMLKMMGGSGRVDPQTGMLHFDDDGGDSGNDNGSDSNSDGSGSENSFDDGSMASSMGYSDSIGSSDPSIDQTDQNFGYYGGQQNQQAALDNSKTDAFGLGWNGGLQTGLTYTDLDGSSRTNWGNIADSVVSGLGSGAFQTAATLSGYGLPAAVISALANASKGSYTPGGALLGGYFGGGLGALGGSLLGAYGSGKSGSQVASQALGGLVNYGLNQSGLNLGNVAASQFGRGSLEQAIAGNLGAQAQNAAISSLSSVAVNSAMNGNASTGYSGSSYGDSTGNSDASGGSTGISMGGVSGGHSMTSPWLSSQYQNNQNTGSNSLAGIFNAYSTPYVAAQTTQTPYVNAPVAQLPQALQTLLQGGQQGTSMYRQPKSLANMLNTGDYYAD